MQNILCYVNAANVLGECRESSGYKPVDSPMLIIGSKTNLKLRLFDGGDGNTAYPAARLSDVVSWSWTMNSGFALDTTPKVIADNENIELETGDDNGTDYTQINIPITEMNTQELSDYLGVAEYKKMLHGELVGYDTNGEPVFILQIKDFSVRNRITGVGEPTELIEDYYTAAQTRALLAAKEAALGNPSADGMILSSTIAGVRTWIVAPTGTGGGSVWIYGDVDPTTEGENGYFYLNNVTGDVFYKAAGAWGTAILRIKGTDGNDGVTYYPYFAYASDGSGTGFSMTPSSSLKYMAMIVSDAPISSPDIDDFSEAIWVKYIGDDGTGGGGSVDEGSLIDLANAMF